MKDLRPGWYYRPNEGMRYWDGDNWTTQEPQVDGTEGPSTPTPPSERAVGSSRSAKRTQPLLTVGLILAVAVAVAGIVTALLLLRGNTQGDLGRSPSAALGELETPDSDAGSAHDMSVRPHLKPTDVPRTEGEVCALAAFVKQNYAKEISGAISGGGYATGDMTGLGFALILATIGTTEAPGDLGELGRQLPEPGLLDRLNDGFLAPSDAQALSDNLDGIISQCRDLGGIEVSK